MAEKLTASVLAAVLTFGMMAPQTAMTAEAAAKSTLEKDVQKLVKKSKAKKEKTQKKQLKKLFQYVEKNYYCFRHIMFRIVLSVCSIPVVPMIPTLRIVFSISSSIIPSL
jgi:2-phosphoglycerate kinase